MERDLVHNKMQTRPVMVCRECGYRRGLQECHTESDLYRADVTEKQIAQEKAQAYQKIRRDRQPPQYTANRNYRPVAQPQGRAQQAKASPTGCFALAVIVIVIFAIIISFFSEL